MSYYIPDSEIERFIEEDVPYGDLTTQLLGISDKQGRIIYSAREETTVCCTEEAVRLLHKMEVETDHATPSRTFVSEGAKILEAHGLASALHSGWRAALNLLEYASGIASRTARMVKAARAANSGITVLTTRKSFPGTKKIVIKAIMAGGALPHRLGLSESILVFKQHTAFMGGLEEFLKVIPALRVKAHEKKIIVEAENVAEAVRLATFGVDVIQVDKLQPDQIAALVREIHAINPVVKVSAAGGINENNIVEYAASGVDIIVLSSVYFGKPADIGVSIVAV